MLDVVERSAENFSVGAYRPVFDRENAFRVFCRHAEKRGDFHPEEGARSAGSDSRRDAHDVAGSNGRGERRAERAEARNFAFAFLFVVDDVAERVVQVHHLEASEANRQHEPDEQNENDERNAPDETVCGIEELVDYFHGVTFERLGNWACQI